MNASGAGRIEVGGRLVEHQDAGAWAPARRPGPGAAAARRTAAASAAVPARRAPPRRAPPGTRERIAARGQARFSRPKATSSSTRSITSWLSGSCQTIPTRAATTAGSRLADLATVEREVTAHRPPGCRAGSGRRWPARACSCRTRTARRRASCGPAGSSNETPSRASRSEPRWPIERLRAASDPGATVGGRQSGNPSSTPARLSERCRATRSTGHDHDRRDRHEHEADGLDDRVDFGVVEDPVVDPCGGGTRDGRDREDRERPDPVQREREDELRRGALDEAGQERVDAPEAAEEGRDAGRDHLGEEGRARLADDQRGEHGGHQPDGVAEVAQRQGQRATGRPAGRTRPGPRPRTRPRTRRR